MSWRLQYDDRYCAEWQYGGNDSRLPSYGNERAGGTEKYDASQVMRSEGLILHLNIHFLTSNRSKESILVFPSGTCQNCGLDLRREA